MNQPRPTTDRRWQYQGAGHGSTLLLAVQCGHKGRSGEYKGRVYWRCAECVAKAKEPTNA